MAERESVTIAFGGGEYAMLPTFGCYQGIEDSVGPLPFLYTSHLQGKLDLRSMALIVGYGLTAAEKKDGHGDQERIMRWLFEAGTGADHIRDSITTLLLNLMFTPEELQKKRDAEAEMDAMMAQTLMSGTTSLS